MLKSMRKSKNRYFYNIFVFPGDAPGAITLSVVWMEREFDAYKLSRCVCPSNYNRLTITITIIGTLDPIATKFDTFDYYY